MSESIEANIAAWTKVNEELTDPWAERHWGSPEIRWGIFGIPESEVGALGEVAGLDVVELGCGTAYFSAWLARRGARPTGVDPTPAQLATARRMVEKTGIQVELVEAAGEAVPLPDAAFDLAVSEYGASLWADPFKWVPEAARLLRPGGLLVFLTNSVLVYLTAPDSAEEMVGNELLRPLFGMYRVQWDGAMGVEYHLAHGDWVELLRRHGFEIEALHELLPGESAENPDYYDFVDVEWARKWPAEEIWVARKA
jgi:SAM-dependent methyltransferase